VPKSSINVLHLSWICFKKSPMQISKLSVAICATLVGVLPLAVHADSEAQAKAREALEKAMSQPVPQTTPTPSAPAKTAAQPAAPAATATSTPSMTMPNVPAGMSSEDTDKVRAALRQKMAEQQNQPVAVKPVSTTTPQPVVVKPTTPPPGHHMTTPPGPPPVAHTAIQAPALPISATKEAQLQELLVRYKADQISPEDYHKERAKILAGP
jgi:hypothetical protein